jgi:predicted Rossmann-fold nucleotide-binding protein
MSVGKSVEIPVDEEVLPHLGRIYTDNTELQCILQRYATRVATLGLAQRLIEDYLTGKRLVWGFSGYATPGFDYSVESRGMTLLYNRLAEMDHQPALSIDGGVSAGVLGLNAIIAKEHRVATLGCIPFKGLTSISARDHMVVWGATYQEREVLVGTLPDVLVCVGGGDGTRRECQAALRQGSVVMLLALRDYGPASLPETHQNFSEMRSAAHDGRLIVCRSEQDIAASVEAAITAATHTSSISRPARLQTIRRLLSV